MASVNSSTGWVDNSQVPVLKNWNKSNTIENALEALRKEMEGQAFKKLKQPDEGAVFP